MTLDLVDRAFLARITQAAEPDAGVGASAGTSAPAAERPADPILDTLLARCPEGWARLADRVVAAWDSGDRVIAVTGRARGEGRSVVVAGLVHVLRGRGLPVSCLDTGPASAREADDAGPDGGVVIVDAGIWFPPGPVHRGRLARAAFGCHAAVLVRRGARPPCPAHEAALVALGIHVLGEVVTLADSPPPAPDSR